MGRISCRELQRCAQRLWLLCAVSLSPRSALPVSVLRRGLPLSHALRDARRPRLQRRSQLDERLRRARLPRYGRRLRLRAERAAWMSQRPRLDGYGLPVMHAELLSLRLQRRLLLRPAPARPVHEPAVRRDVLAVHGTPCVKRKSRDTSLHEGSPMSKGRQHLQGSRLPQDHRSCRRSCPCRVSP
jgi:hypothetical protein